MASLTPRGPFSLRAAAEFGFGPNEGRAPTFDGAMRLAFPLDGGQGYAGAVLRQPEPSAAVDVELHANPSDSDLALTQVARIVSLDGDGEEFARVGERDPVIGRLQAEHPGQRPVLFHSPYEAAAWSIISARRPAGVAARVRTALGAALGETFALAGQELPAFPQPDRLVSLDEFPGLDATKLDRLRGVARAALDGELDAARLQSLGAEAAYTDVQRLKGLGPFYASLVVLRATGFADAPLSVAEPRLLGHVGRLYSLGGRASLEQYLAIAERWRPFRTWATVLVRLAGERS